eukprot:CAMPEP_0194296724 /NCGR_PEP_ID=MMETSP0169-20130528/56957_1 /TAXON_ID=218684 /ORGANISM="Corethron pennatum, Strain L29A3" /LENGTH=46 /DNA_ID= /DNA_START= /DNA_END= /DNA_ORIENTATION=
MSTRMTGGAPQRQYRQQQNKLIPSSRQPRNGSDVSDSTSVASSAAP